MQSTIVGLATACLSTIALALPAQAAIVLSLQAPAALEPGDMQFIEVIVSDLPTGGNATYDVMLNADVVQVQSVTSPPGFGVNGISGSPVDTVSLRTTVNGTQLVRVQWLTEGIANFTLDNIEAFDEFGAPVAMPGTDLTGIVIGTPVADAVPEPATLALFGLGVAGLGFARRRRPAD